MAMDDRVWLRHASARSVWTRILTPLPLLAAAIWSRVWLGPLASVPVAAALAWIWLNPRLFAAPKTLQGWSVEGVLGERVFLRHRGRVAPHHRRSANVLTALSALGVLPYAWGLWALDPWAVASGILMISAFKAWFVDRMVWVWHDFQREGGTLEELQAGSAARAP